MAHKGVGRVEDNENFDDVWLREFGDNDVVLALKPFAKKWYLAGIMWGAVTPILRLEDLPC